ncbi:MAG: T9SS type A sorting domain-containing protein [Lewinellaceae bacterium]|nr:T9SS type A sorting domain-containing protein [Lewinellaceae bacterium]
MPEVIVDEIIHDVNDLGVGAISVTPAGIYIFAWSKDGQPFSDSEDLTGLHAGSYTLVITDAVGCTASIGPIVISNMVGTSEPGLTGSVRLWPNPAHSAIQLEIIDLDVIAACIVDLRGGLVQQIQPSELSSEIEIRQLPEGMYCLKISAANGRVLSLKFVKVD